LPKQARDKHRENSTTDRAVAQDEITHTLWPQLIAELTSTLGETENATKLTQIGDTYHVVGCKSPEYNCYPPFSSRMCSTNQDCNYEISQLRWGLSTILSMLDTNPALAHAPCSGNDTTTANALACAVDFGWWRKLLLGGALAWYPFDSVPGFRLD